MGAFGNLARTDAPVRRAPQPIGSKGPSRDSALADTGVDITHTITTFADYEVQAGQESYFSQSIQGGVKIEF